MVELEDAALEAALLLDLGSGEIAPMAQCSTPAATLSHTDGEAVLGETFTLAMEAAQATGALPALAIASQPFSLWPPCGLQVPGLGEILIDFAPPNPLVTLIGPPDAGAPTSFPLGVPVQEGLIGFDLYAQGLYLDFAGASAEPFRATNGLVINVGL